MFRSVLVLALILCLAPATTSAQDSTAVVGAVDEFHAALMAKDTVDAMALLAPEAVVLEGGHLETRSEYAGGHLSADMEFLSGMKRQIVTRTIRIEGDLAWVSTTSHMAGEYYGKSIETNGAELMVLSRHNDGWMYGRGAGDMKAGLASNLFALDALGAVGFAPAADVYFQSVVEEECTGNGALACLQRGYRADAALIPEPFAEELVSAQLGVLWFQVHLKGIPVHVAYAGSGANAIEAAIPLIAALHEMEDRWNLPSCRHHEYHDHNHALNLNIGKIEGGDWTSSVPAWCVFDVRMGLFPGQDLNDAKCEIEEVLRKAAQENDFLRNNQPEIIYHGFNAEAKKFYERYRNLFKALFEVMEFQIRPDDFGVMPGVGELIFMDRLYDVYIEGDYDMVVIDSAPTALVLPLLKLPELTTGIVTRLLGMKSKWTKIFNMLDPGFGDAVLAEVRRLRSKAETMRNALIDTETTSITVVLIPEKAAVLESERLINTVESHGVTVDSIIINHVVSGCDCDYCQKRMSAQGGYIEHIKEKYGEKRIAILPSYGEEMKGKALMEVARELYERGQLSM